MPGEGAARRDLSADRPEVDSGRGLLHSQGCWPASSLEEGMCVSCAVFPAPGCCACSPARPVVGELATGSNLLCIRGILRSSRGVFAH